MKSLTTLQANDPLLPLTINPKLQPFTFNFPSTIPETIHDLFSSLTTPLELKTVSHSHIGRCLPKLLDFLREAGGIPVRVCLLFEKFKLSTIKTCKCRRVAWRGVARRLAPTNSTNQPQRVRACRIVKVSRLVRKTSSLRGQLKFTVPKPVKIRSFAGELPYSLIPAQSLTFGASVGWALIFCFSAFGLFFSAGWYGTRLPAVCSRFNYASWKSPILIDTNAKLNRGWWGYGK